MGASYVTIKGFLACIAFIAIGALERVVVFPRMFIE